MNYKTKNPCGEIFIGPQFGNQSSVSFSENIDDYSLLAVQDWEISLGEITEDSFSANTPRDPQDDLSDERNS